MCIQKSPIFLSSLAHHNLTHDTKQHKMSSSRVTLWQWSQILNLQVSISHLEEDMRSLQDHIKQETLATRLVRDISHPSSLWHCTIALHLWLHDIFMSSSWHWGPSEHDLLCYRPRKSCSVVPCKPCTSIIWAGICHRSPLSSRCLLLYLMTLKMIHKRSLYSRWMLPQPTLLKRLQSRRSLHTISRRKRRRFQAGQMSADGNTPLHIRLVIVFCGSERRASFK